MRKWVIVLAAAGMLVSGLIVFGGFVDVAATSGHLAPVKWMLETTRRSTVRRVSKSLTAPNLDGQETIRRGAAAYAAMCENCHAAPGRDADDTLTGGLMPRPPALVEIVNERTPEELFWVTKHGIKMTGMPAWGPSHSDSELWEIVAFMRVMPTTSPEIYRRLRIGDAEQAGMAVMPAPMAATGEPGHSHPKGHSHGGSHAH